MWISVGGQSAFQKHLGDFFLTGRVSEERRKSSDFLANVSGCHGFEFFPRNSTPYGSVSRGTGKQNKVFGDRATRALNGTEAPSLQKTILEPLIIYLGIRPQLRQNQGWGIQVTTRDRKWRN